MSRSNRVAPIACALLILTLAPPVRAQNDTPNHLFVQSLYRDLLGRPVDAFGNQIASEMNQALHTREQVATLILTSQEHQQRQVRDYYRQFLGREPVPTEVAGLFPQLTSPGYDTVRGFILASPDYFIAAGNNNSAFINSIYQDLLGRDADPAGLSTFLNFLTSGGTRPQLLQQIQNSPEFHSRLVDQYYRQYLDRPADPGALSSFTQILSTGANDPTVIVPILASQEYFQNALPEPAAGALFCAGLIPLMHRRRRARGRS